MVDTPVESLPTLGVKGVRPVHPDIVRGLAWAVEPLIVMLCGLVTYAAYGFELPAMDLRYASAILSAAAVASVAFTTLGAYEADKVFARIPQLGQVLSGWLIAAAVLLALAWGLKVTDYYSRLWVGTFFIGTAGGLAIGRFVMAGVVNGMAARGRVAQRVAVLGTGEGARQVVSSLRRERDFRYRIVGVFDDGHGDGAVPLEVERAPVLGDLDTLVSMIRNEGVDEVLIAMPAAEEERLVAILDRLSSLSVHVRLAPDPIVFRFAKRPITTLLGVPLIHVFERPISGWSSFLKMAEDRILSGLAVLFLAPLMLTIALLIKLDSPGPVLFAQQRRGLNSRLFRVYKFRTMYHDMADAECRQQTLRDDPRVTRIGRFLRATSLDELPQLFNVLKGDMSLVGPRPHAVATKAAGHLFEDVVREYAARYRVKPGITGWAQVNGWRGETDTVEKIEKRVEFDIYYIENWSIGLDLWILIRTAFLVFRDPRAY